MSLPLPTPPMLLGFMFVSELWLMRSRLSSDRSREADGGSLRRLLLVILGSVGLAWLAARGFPQARVASLFGLGPAAMAWLYGTGLGLFAAGVGLRWYAMAYLGRLFTFDVAIVADHRVVDSGPYRLIRHPAYAGALLTYVGIGVCGGNLLSLLVLMVPIIWVFRHRVAIEEAVLTAALGQPYVGYMARTRRFIPFVY